MWKLYRQTVYVVFEAWSMFLIENCTTHVRKSGSLRIWRPQRRLCLPSRQEQSEPTNRLVGLRKRAPNRLLNQPHAPLPPPHQPVTHSLCLSCKVNVCNSSKCAILVPTSFLLFLWIPKKICAA